MMRKPHHDRVPPARSMTHVVSVVCFLCSVTTPLTPLADALAADMKYPDIEAQWRNPTANRGGNPWDPNKPMRLAQQAPLTEEYHAIFEASIKAQKTGGQGNSAGSTCRLAGMPKMMNFAEPMEIVIRPTVTYFIPVQDPPRRIYTDGRDWPADDAPSFGGASRGRWVDEDGDGHYDVLEIETRNFVGPRVFESTGLPLHRDNRTVVKERIYLDKSNKDVLHDEVTTLDHALTRPWTVDRVYLRTFPPRWIEKNCHESNPHLRIGADEFFLSADGKLMPVTEDRPPPDLSYFKSRSADRP
jgi:hypothetical protein